MGKSRWWLSGLLLLTACQAPLDLGVAETPASRRATPAEAKAPSPQVPDDEAPGSPGPTDRPEAAASTAADPAASAPAAAAASPVLLARPAGAARLIRGTVALDGSYALASGAGRIISNNGASTVAFADAALLSNNGGNVISRAGALGKLALPVIGIIGNNGGSLISDKGQAYRVAATGEGALLPAAGLALRVASLRNGDFLPIGVDPAGEPVYEAYSNARGEYELYVPASELDNVLLVAHVPGKADARLSLSLVVAEGESRPALDDDSSQLATFLRTAFADVLRQDVDMFLDALATETIEQVALKTLEVYPEPMREVVRQSRIRWLNAAVGAGARGYDARQRRLLAQRMNDTILSFMALSAIRTDYAKFGLSHPDTAAVPALVDALRDQRLSVGAQFARLAAEGIDPAVHFASKPSMKRVEETLGQSFTIRTPTDAIAFAIYGILANIQMPRSEARALYEEVVTSADYGLPVGTGHRVYATAQAIYNAYLVAFYYDAKVGPAVVEQAGRPIE